MFLARISSGAWRPAEVLPSEQALADELGVSQGTVRKALDSLANDNLVERRQGKGTFVAKHTQESAQFRFFRLCGESGDRALPTCKHSVIKLRRAKPVEARTLQLDSGAEIFEIDRTRYVDDQPILHETISLAAEKFPNLDGFQPLPNTLYTLYQSEYGVSINAAEESIRATAATAQIARRLRTGAGEPLLCVERLALDVNRAPVELRRSFYLTDAHHYAVSLN